MNQIVKPRSIETINLPLGVVILVQYQTRYEVCSSFMRIQEFYESDLPEIRGEAFSFEKYMDTYARAKGNFSYTMDWSGFNIPGKIFKEWGKRFPTYERLEKEQHLYSTVMDMYTGSALGRGFAGKDTDFYVIGTYIEGPRRYRVIMHELAHALWAMDPEYKARAEELVATSPYNHKILPVLKKWGYTDMVLPDELNAYQATSSPHELMSKFEVDGLNLALVSLYDEFAKKHKLPTYELPSFLEELDLENKYRAKYGWNAGEIV
jgi:hypothetical protein